MNFSLKAKGLINPVSVRYSLLPFFVLVFIGFEAAAQVERPIKNPAKPLPVKQDSIQRPTRDSLVLNQDTIKQKIDTVKTPPHGDIETTINYTARDSIRATLDGKMIWLYGEAKIQYGMIELEAEEITIDYANNLITAEGKRDSLGNRIGYPIFKNGPELYETKGMTYNFKTRRARITEVVTQQGEGYLHSDAAFKNEKNEILSVRNSYTTCNLEHPHFRIRATKTKAIPNDKIVAGPFFMEFNDIPLPIGFLFGMFPAQRESKSGIIFPSYGEERIRGFNLRNGGYFFDISEYMKLAVTGDIYSKGGHALYVNSNYMKRYAYNGSFNFSYSKNRLGTNIEDTDVSNDFRITWSHSPQSKGTGRFSASVNAATTTFNRNNNLMFGGRNDFNSNQLNNFTTKLSSNVSYNKRFAGTPFSMGLNLSHNQDLVTKLVDLPLPNLTVNMTNLYPFQRKGKTGPLDNFSIGYSMVGTHRITNQISSDSIAPFTAENLSFFLKQAKKGIRHSIPMSYSFKVKHFTVSPSVSYEEQWHFEKLDWRLAQDEKGTYIEVADTIPGFNRVANYNASVGITTRLYGIYFFKRGKVKAIRHVVNPSVSLGITPDFSNNTNYFNKIVKPLGPSPLYATQLIYKSRHQGFLNGGSALGKSGSIGFGIGNNLEMKVKSQKDTVERKVMLLNNLSINSSYNLVADSFKLAPFSLAANTNILDNTINVNLSATLDPYNYVTDTNKETGKSTERRTDSYVWNAGKLGRITSATLAVNTNLNSEKRKKESESREKIGKSELPDQDKQYLLQNPNTYLDFDIPWSLNLGYSLTYSHSLNQSPKVIQTVQMSGDLSISQKWKITYSTGYHFEEQEFVPTTLGISRDLHCWTMNLSWVPFGRYQSYNFTIAVKASILQDLKLERRKPFFDNL
ncbi:MAG: putative LPS assembly protein LptD [Bacteroidota bacterium]